MSDDPILHHYPQSPFSEKVRLAFGVKRMAWRSVHIPTTSSLDAALRSRSSPRGVSPCAR